MVDKEVESIKKYEQITNENLALKEKYSVLEKRFDELQMEHL